MLLCTRTKLMRLVCQQDGFFVAKLYKLSNKKKDEPSAGRAEQAQDQDAADKEEADEEDEEEEAALRPRSKNAKASTQQKRPRDEAGDAPQVKAKKAAAASGGEARRVAGRLQKDRR